MSGTISRREFMKNTAKGVAVASIPLVFGGRFSKAFAAPSMGNMKLNDYYNHFGITEEMMQKVMATALSNGGDYSDLFFQHRIFNYVKLEDGEVNRAYSRVELGVGIRVLKGDQTGYSYSEDISINAMNLAAKTAANIAGGSKKIGSINIKALSTPNFYPVKTSWEDVKIDKRIPILQKVNSNIKQDGKHINKIDVSLQDEVSYILVVNSDGNIVFDSQPMAILRAFCTAEKDGQRESNGYSLAGRYGIDYFTEEKLKFIAKKSVDDTMILFDAVKPTGGEMEVVLAAGSSGILLHEAMGHPMEADFNRKGTSIFADKIGKPVAEKFVSIVDDGTIPHSRGAINVDDETNPSQKTFLIKDGILESYMHDRISAEHYGVKPTGNGRRESFRFAPLPRMRNTYMLPGPHKKEEIIQSVKNGIYAETFTNGEVFIGAGDFTFYVKKGYLIENGKMTRPIKDINIIGNGPDILSKINMVADDLKFSDSSWTCGKDGQRVPVSLGLPTAKIPKITVGGKA